MKQNQKPGDWYCPKCETFIMGQNVTYTKRHDNCGEPVEWHEHENAMPDLPQWVYWLAVAVLASAIMWTAHAAEKRNKEQQRIERDKETIKGFSRMSTSPEIQEAYDRLYPQKKISKNCKISRSFLGRQKEKPYIYSVTKTKTDDKTRLQKLP